MSPDSRFKRRRQIRLKGYDYSSPGAYFTTVCTVDREPLFGEITEGEMNENRYAEIVYACWKDPPAHYPHVELDAFVIMPNHIHGIIILTDTNPVGVGAGFTPPLHRPTKTRCAVTGYRKSFGR